MAEPHPMPWNPDRRWADPLIALLLLLAALTTFEAVHTLRKLRPEAKHPGLPTRVLELRAAAQKATHRPQPLAVPASTGPWDRAVLAVLLAENGQLGEGRRLAETAPAPFLELWKGIYAEGELPTSSQVEALRQPFGGSYAYWQFRGRLAERQHQDPGPWQAKAWAWAWPRMVVLGLGGLALVALGLGGIISAGVMALSPKQLATKSLHPCPMSGRAVALTLLGWFVALRFSGTVAALLFAFVPLPKVLALPMAYSFHVWIGARLLLRAEGVSFRQAWRRMTPGPLPRAMGWALGFLGIALVSVLLVGLLTQPFLRHAQPPQQELLELVSSQRHWLATLLLFATMAGLAPLFEEWLFRGTLLPWMGHRFSLRWKQGGWLLAVVITGVTFGAMHLQPAALPGLCTLGMVLGWAFLRSGNLWTTVAMHACWNGGVFVMIQLLA